MNYVQQLRQIPVYNKYFSNTDEKTYDNLGKSAKEVQQSLNISKSLIYVNRKQLKNKLDYVEKVERLKTLTKEQLLDEKPYFVNSRLYCTFKNMDKDTYRKVLDTKVQELLRMPNFGSGSIPVLFFDEPTLGMSPEVEMQFFEYMSQWSKKYQILVVTNSPFCFVPEANIIQLKRGYINTRKKC